MALLKTVDAKLFQTEIPYKPMGKYVHFLTIRVTESYPLFQTDSELNKARVRAGVKDKQIYLAKCTEPLPIRLFGLCYAMEGGYKGWNPYIERHLAIFVNCFLSRAN